MKMPVFKQKAGLKFTASSQAYIDTLAVGPYVFDIKKQKSKATASMFGYLYGYVYLRILSEMGEFKTQENIAELDKTLKAKFGVTHVVKSYSLRRKRAAETHDTHRDSMASRPFVKVEERVEPKSKRLYTVDEMQDYWIALQQFAAEFWNLQLSDPDPNWKKEWLKGITGKTVKNDKKGKDENWF